MIICISGQLPEADECPLPILTLNVIDVCDFMDNKRLALYPGAFSALAEIL